MNILVVKLSAIGDVIHALPVSHAIKEKNPESRLTWMVEKPAYDLLTNNPDIDEIIVFEKSKFKSFSGFMQNSGGLKDELRDKSFDVALDLQGLFKSAALTWMSGATKRLGYCNMRELSGLISKPVCGAHQNGHIVQRYLDVARALGCKVDQPEWVINPSQEDQDKTKEILREAGVNPGEKYIIIAPGTNWQSKCWPTDSYAELATKLWNYFKTPLVIIGASGDKGLAQSIQEKTPVKLFDITGKTTLKQLAYTIEQSILFVGGDTGPMHLAVAMGAPVVALFGPTDPARNGPYGENNIVVQTRSQCAPCWKKNCSDLECMRKISPQEVFDAVLKITSCSDIRR